MRLLDRVFDDRRLRLEPCNVDSVAADVSGLRKVLGAIIAQAMNDGMTKVCFALSPETGEPSMKYFGPAESTNPLWWDMEPPPAYCYPVLLQVCFQLADVASDYPPKGVIQGLVERQPVQLQWTAVSLSSFEIAWDIMFAKPRSVTIDHKSPGMPT